MLSLVFHRNVSSFFLKGGKIELWRGDISQTNHDQGKSTASHGNERRGKKKMTKNEDLGRETHSRNYFFKLAKLWTSSLYASFWVLLQFPGISTLQTSMEGAEVLWTPRHLCFRSQKGPKSKFNNFSKFHFVKCWKTADTLWKYDQKAFIRMVTWP